MWTLDDESDEQKRRKKEKVNWRKYESRMSLEWEKKFYY